MWQPFRSRRYTFTVTGAVGAVALGATPTVALQTPVLLQDEPRHTLVVPDSLDIGLRDGAQGVVLGHTDWVAKGPRGRYFLGSPRKATLEVFDSGGAFVGALGREGQGPGEFQSSYDIMFHQGRLVVTDAMQRRLAFFDIELSESGGVTLPFTPDGSAAFLGRHVVFNAHVPTRETLGLPIQVYSIDSGEVRAVGGDDRWFSAMSPGAVRRRLAGADTDRYWAARIDEYRIDLLTVDGDTLLSVLGSPPFLPERVDAVRTSTEAPPPLVTDIASDSSGHLWVLVLVPDPEWHDAVVRDAGSAHGWRIADYSAYYDTVLDVIDPATGELLGRRRFDPMMPRLVDAGEIAFFTYRDPSHPVMRVYRVAFSTQRRIP